MGPSRMVPVAPLDWVPRYEKRRRFVAERTFRLSVVWMREPMGRPVEEGGGVGSCVGGGVGSVGVGSCCVGSEDGGGAVEEEGARKPATE
jgi:hypothetical protein